MGGAGNDEFFVKKCGIKLQMLNISQFFFQNEF